MAALNLSAGAPAAVVNAAWLLPSVGGDVATRFRPAAQPFEVMVGALPPACAEG